MANEILLLENSISDLEWFQENAKELLEKFRGEFIAIKNHRIVANAIDISALFKKLDEEKISSSDVLIEYIPPKDVVVIF